MKVGKVLSALLVFLGFALATQAQSSVDRKEFRKEGKDAKVAGRQIGTAFKKGTKKSAVAFKKGAEASKAKKTKKALRKSDEKHQ